MEKRQNLRPEKDRPRLPPKVEPKPLWKKAYEAYEARKRRK